MKRCPPRMLSAFTLIELLLVIGIVAVLSVIIFPLVRSSTVSAKQARCLHQLKQLHQAIASYAGDHRGEIPVDRVTPGNGTNWYIPLQTYVYPASGENYGWDRREGVFFCPGNPMQRGWTNYAMNGNLYEGGQNLGSASEDGSRADFLAARSAVRFSQVSPTKVLLIDSFNGGDGSWYLNSGSRWDPAWTNTYETHRDAVNVLFVGGNVSLVRVTPHAPSGSGDLQELKAEWFWPLQ